MKIIFLDVDGVLNCQLFYTGRDLKQEGGYTENNICRERVSWLNDLCKETGAKVVISSTWRMGRAIEELKEIFLEVGATFEIIDKTPVLRDDAYVRGNEIAKWIKDNDELIGEAYYDYKDYVIIDDDSDMLYSQRNNLFLTDTYSGLTPNTCHRIKRFFGVGSPFA